MGYYICEARKGDKLIRAVTLKGLISKLSKTMNIAVEKEEISKIKDAKEGMYKGYSIIIYKEEELEDMWLEEYKKGKEVKKKKIGYSNYVLLRNPVTHGLGRLYESL